MYYKLRDVNHSRVAPHTKPQSSKHAVSADARAMPTPGLGSVQRAPDQAGLVSPSNMTQLQRTVGNAALARLVGQQETGRNASAPRIQRAALQVGPVQDQFEAEADRVAKQVTGGSPKTSSSEGAKHSNSKQQVQRVAYADGGKVTSDVESSIQRARGGNKGLDEGMRTKMESGFGMDFSNVRVHNDAKADRLSRSMDAKAFTVGQDMFFRQGAYNPGSRDGQQLVAHELTHVVQQTGGAQRAVQRKTNRQVVKLHGTDVGVQRMVSAKKFKSKTSLFGRKGKSHAFFSEMRTLVAQYHAIVNNPTASAGEKVTHLDQMLKKINEWLSGPLAGTSSRRRHIVALKTEIEQTIPQLEQNLPTLGNDFTDTNVTASTDNAVGDAMNKLDLVEYNFGVRSLDPNVHDDTQQDRKVQGGSFTGYFKSDVDRDLMHDRHRGGWAGIPEYNPEFGDRNIAMLKLDRLLNSNVLPPTFRATHNNKRGIVMQKVEGKTGRQLHNDDEEDKLEHPLVRQGLSKLYMLDFIAAQVDRHPGNYIVEMQDGQIIGVKGIDNDLAFGKDFDVDNAEAAKNMLPMVRPTLGLLPSQLTEIDQTFAQRIVDVATDPDLVRNCLAGYLTHDEIEATVDRLLRLANFLRPLLTNGDGRIKTQWD